MKKSELKKYIKEQIVDALSEVTIVDKMTKTDEIPQIAKDEDKEVSTVKKAVDTAKESGKPVTIAEKDEDDVEVEDTIKELFNIYPESEDQIYDPNIKAIYKLLKAVNPNIENPISLDKSKPKVIKIARDFEKDKIALSALTKLTGEDFQAFADLLKTKRGKERYKLKAEEKLVWNGITILFGAGAKNLPKGSEPYDTAASWRNTRKLSTLLGLINEKDEDDVEVKDDWYKSKDEDGDKDKEPSKSDLKKDAKATKGIAKAKDELAVLTREMKSLARKYKEAKGADKDKIVADLKEKTKLKKELEAILDK